MSPRPHRPNVSADLVWEIVSPYNSYIVKRKTGGGVKLSRDTLNLRNIHCRRHAGFVNERALGVRESPEGGVVVISKKAKHKQCPPASINTTIFDGHKSRAKTFKAIANMTAKSDYRPDLRAAAVSRTSAIIRSQKPIKPTAQRKTRGKKAKAAAAEKA